MGARGYVKEGLELTPMGPFNIEQGGVNSGIRRRGSCFLALHAGHNRSFRPEMGLLYQHIYITGYSALALTLISKSFFLPIDQIFRVAGRVRIIQARFKPIQYQMLARPGFVYVWIWGCFSTLGYILGSTHLLHTRHPASVYRSRGVLVCRPSWLWVKL